MTTPPNTYLELQRIEYADLNAKQKEIYNFQKVAALLADYGFNCVKLDDDWNGADFLALHKDGRTLRVQLKARATIDRKYEGRDVHMAFPAGSNWYLVAHDDLKRIAAETTSWLESRSWKEGGNYSSDRPSRKMLDELCRCALGPRDLSAQSRAG